MAYFDLSKLNLAEANVLKMFETDVIKWHWGTPATKMSNSRLSNKDKLWRRILLLWAKT